MASFIYCLSNPTKNKKYSNLPLKEAFRKLTDGADCPISNCYKPEEFESLVKLHGFDGAYGRFNFNNRTKMLPEIHKAIEDQSLAIYEIFYLA